MNLRPGEPLCGAALRTSAGKYGSNEGFESSRVPE